MTALTPDDKVRSGLHGGCRRVFVEGDWQQTPARSRLPVAARGVRAFDPGEDALVFSILNRCVGATATPTSRPSRPRRTTWVADGSGVRELRTAVPVCVAVRARPDSPACRNVAT